MKKSLFLSLLTGALLAGCSSSDLETTYEKEVLQHRQIPVEFGSFLGNAANTRAGEVGELTTTALQATTSQGFGVFAYYTNGNGTTDGSYVASGDNGSQPNFMYNEQVTYDAAATKWTYSPIKYWPNEFQTSGTGGTAEHKDKLSFFAYAPWVGKTDGTNAVLTDMGTSGIMSFSANDYKGDPTVTYKVAANAANSVDLLWATNNSLATPTLLNMTKPTVGTKVQFTFGHALSRLGMKIRAVVDETAKDGTNAIDGSTTIYLNSITVKGSAIYDEGTLNLHTGVWTPPTTPSTTFNLTVGESDINLSTTAADKRKVTTTLTDVLNGGKGSNDPNKYFMFIPNESSAGGDLEVTVDYTVETADPALAGKLGDGQTAGIKIDNVITNKLTAFKPEKGKAYNLDILIGVTSVEVAATVADWTNDTTENNIWVPINR